MKKRLIRLVGVFTLFALLLSFTGCGLNQTKLIKSSDGLCQIVVPSSWKESKEKPNGCNIALEDKVGQISFQCIPMSKKDEDEDATVETVMKEFEGINSFSMDEYKFANDKDLTINYNKAKYTEISGKMNGEEYVAFMAIVEGKDNYYCLACTTYKSKADKKRDLCMHALQTFVEK